MTQFNKNTIVQYNNDFKKAELNLLFVICILLKQCGPNHTLNIKSNLYFLKFFLKESQFLQVTCFLEFYFHYHLSNLYF